MVTAVKKHEWTETSISKVLAQKFMQRSTLIVPNCYWTGHECDLLVIEKGLRIVDIEIKLSRADLKADAAKDKWWEHRPWQRRRTLGDASKRQWPDKVWKHYYALPESVWGEDMAAHMPPTSGILLVRNAHSLCVKRNAKPNREAKPITSADAIDIARLASLRMWAVL